MAQTEYFNNLFLQPKLEYLKFFFQVAKQEKREKNENKKNIKHQNI